MARPLTWGSSLMSAPAPRLTADPPLRRFLRPGGHPRRQVCDGAAVVALEATRLRRVLHCVPALRDASVAWVPQAPSAAIPRTPAGE